MIKGLDIDKVVRGIRLAVIDVLIADLQNLKMVVKKLDIEDLAKRVRKIK